MAADSKVKRIVCTVLAGTFLFSTALPVFAGERAAVRKSFAINEQMKQNKNRQAGSVFKAPGGYLKTTLDKLVEEGKISRDKADKILQYLEKVARERKQMTKEQRKELRKRGSLLDSLIKENVITQTEADMIREKHQAMRDEKFTDRFDTLVKKGVLTTNDVEKIISYMKTEREKRKEELVKLKEMTAEERKKYFEENKAARKSILEKMVEDKIITEAQAEEIKKEMPGFHKPGMKEHKRMKTRESNE